MYSVSVQSPSFLAGDLDSLAQSDMLLDEGWSFCTKACVTILRVVEQLLQGRRNVPTETL